MPILEALLIVVNLPLSIYGLYCLCRKAIDYAYDMGWLEERDRLPQQRIFVCGSRDDNGAVARDITHLRSRPFFNSRRFDQ